MKTHKHQGLSWLEAGESDAAPILFIGGYGLNKEIWRHQLAALSETYRAIAIDLPGHGESDAQLERASIEGYGAVVNELSSHLDLEAPLLVGHSMGGRVALEATRQNPGYHRGVALVDVSRAVSPDHDPQVRARLSSGEDHKAFRAHMRAMFEQNFSPTCPDAIREEVRASSKALDHETAQRLTPTIGRWDHLHWTEALTLLQAPLFLLQSTYLIYGQSRRILHVGEVTPFFEMVTELQPKAKIEWLPTGHFSMLEEPQAVTSHLRHFAGSLDPHC